MVAWWVMAVDVVVTVVNFMTILPGVPRPSTR